MEFPQKCPSSLVLQPIAPITPRLGILLLLARVNSVTQLEILPLTSTATGAPIDPSRATFSCADIDVAKRSQCRINQDAPKIPSLKFQLLLSSDNVLIIVQSIAIDHLLCNVTPVPIQCDRDWIRKGPRPVEVVGRGNGRVGCISRSRGRLTGCSASCGVWAREQ